jgi:hypothetical protein
MRVVLGQYSPSFHYRGDKRKDKRREREEGWRGNRLGEDKRASGGCSAGPEFPGTQVHSAFAADLTGGLQGR